MQSVVNHGPFEAAHKWTVNAWDGAFRSINDDARCVWNELKKCPGYKTQRGNVRLTKYILLS